MKYFVLVILLVGCSGEQSYYEKAQPEKAQPEWLQAPPSVITDGGIFVYWESEAEQNLPSRERLDELWLEVQQCTSAELNRHNVAIGATPPPILRIVQTWSDSCHGDAAVRGLRGKYCPGAAPYAATVGNLAHIEHIWKHEFMHHLFVENGMTEYYNHEPHTLWFNCEWN